MGLNVEQLFHSAPGGIGRYTARLATLLTTLEPADEVTAFAAAHPPASVRRVMATYGLARPALLGLPRPVLYDLWHLAGAPSLTTLSRRSMLKARDESALTAWRSRSQIRDA